MYKTTAFQQKKPSAWQTLSEKDVGLSIKVASEGILHKMLLEVFA